MPYISICYAWDMLLLCPGSMKMIRIFQKIDFSSAEASSFQRTVATIAFVTFVLCSMYG